MTRALALSLLFTLAACATQTNLRDDKATRLAMFEAVVFSKEYERTQSRALAKWEAPMRIALEGKTAAAHKATVTGHAKTLAALTGLNMSIVPKGRGANVAILFASLDDMEKLAGPRIKNRKEVTNILLTSGCLFFYDTDAKHRIVRATIFVRTGQTANNIPACLLEEMVQILGLPNDSDLIKPSLFNSGATLTQMTELDRTFVRTLYDSRMKAGMPRAQALTIAREALQRGAP